MVGRDRGRWRDKPTQTLLSAEPDTGLSPPPGDHNLTRAETKSQMAN